MSRIETIQESFSTRRPPCPRSWSMISAALCLALGLAAVQGCRRKSKPPERGTELADSTPVSQKSSLVEDPLKKIRAASSVRELATFSVDRRGSIRQAVIMRLGEIGGLDAPKALLDIFRNEPRRAGIDGSAGLRADVVATLGRLGTAEARSALLDISKRWLREGPKVPGDYAHIYDKQYFAVGVAVLKALEPYDDEETNGLLRSVADDVTLFYALREAAWQTTLHQEMARKGLKEPADRAAFLLTRIEPDGALVESRWTGKKPGEKTNAAAREAVLERMIHELGWPAAEPLQTILRDNPAQEPRRTLAAARMLADLVLFDFRAAGNGNPESRHRDAVLTAVDALCALPQAALAPETGSQVFGQLAAAGEVLDDEEVWKSLRELASRITIPDAWTGGPPGADEIGVALPSDSAFIPEYSRRVSGRPGVLVEAWYFSPLAGDELASRLESATGKTATKGERGLGGAKEALWTIELQPAPPEYAGVLTFGVTVRERPGGYSQRLLGRTLREGNTLICVRRVVRR